MFYLLSKKVKEKVAVSGSGYRSDKAEISIINRVLLLRFRGEPIVK